jgi:hydrogenase/urease accessory protein HupE
MFYRGENVLLRRLSIGMFITGLSFVLTMPFITGILPRLFRWFTPMVNIADEKMIVSMYVALGISLMVAAKDPVRHAIIVDYTIISSILHGAVMFYYAIALWDQEWPHLVGDVPFLFLIAIVFMIFHPKRLARAGA